MSHVWFTECQGSASRLPAGFARNAVEGTQPAPKVQAPKRKTEKFLCKPMHKTYWTEMHKTLSRCLVHITSCFNLEGRSRMFPGAYMLHAENAWDRKTMKKKNIFQLATPVPSSLRTSSTTGTYIRVIYVWTLITRTNQSESFRFQSDLKTKDQTCRKQLWFQKGTLRSLLNRWASSWYLTKLALPTYDQCILIIISSWGVSAEPFVCQGPKGSCWCTDPAPLEAPVHHAPAQRWNLSNTWTSPTTINYSIIYFSRCPLVWLCKLHEILHRKAVGLKNMASHSLFSMDNWLCTLWPKHSWLRFWHMTCPRRVSAPLASWNQR